MKQLIYIAEDEKNIRETLYSFLKNDGYEVCAFETGDALLSAFSKRRADLVILDIMMPGTDGLTCCRLIREKDKVPIILLTAKDTEYDYVNGILQGGDDYLTKPFRPTVLLMRVKALLRRVEMERGTDPMDRDRYLDNSVIRSLKVYNAETASEIPVYDLKAAGGRDPYEMFLGGARSIITITNPNVVRERRLVIFRDSFGSSIAPLLAAGYSEITLVDIRYISPSALSKLVDFSGISDVLFLYSASVINNSETIK